MRGRDFVVSVRNQLTKRLGRKAKDADLIAVFGNVVPQTLYNLNKRSNVTPRQMAGLVLRVEEKSIEKAEARAIRTIVEFLPIRKTKKGKGRFEIFSKYNANGSTNKYLDGLLSELSSSVGIYIFHDSRGKALYVRTRSQTLWSEINQAFNRYREVQKIRNVKHPTNNVVFKSSEEKRRQIRERTVVLHEVAGFVSAYTVARGLIGELESLLIRSFANDILNKTNGKFGTQGKAYQEANSLNRAQFLAPESELVERVREVLARK